MVSEWSTAGWRSLCTLQAPINYAKEELTMGTKHEFAAALGMITLITPRHAFACGDPSVIFLIAGIMSFQLVLLIIIVSARRNPLQERLKFSALYLLSLIVIWIVSSVFVHNWLDAPGQNVFETVALIVMPIISIVIFRLILSKKD